MTPKLSPEATAILSYLKKNRKTVLPTLPDIQQHFGWQSKTAAVWHVNKLVAAGKLEKTKGGYLQFPRQKKSKRIQP